MGKYLPLILLGLLGCDEEMAIGFQKGMVTIMSKPTKTYREDIRYLRDPNTDTCGMIIGAGQDAIGLPVSCDKLPHGAKIGLNLLSEIPKCQ